MAVQSHFFGVGSLVSWAGRAWAPWPPSRSSSRPTGRARSSSCGAGKSAPQALQELLSADAQEDARQVAMIDRAGRVAVHTGPGCIAHAGHAVGDQVSAQANIMAARHRARRDARCLSPPPAVDLAERLLAALDAAEEEGGDLRGRQSAALLVVARPRHRQAG